MFTKIIILTAIFALKVSDAWLFFGNGQGLFPQRRPSYQNDQCTTTIGKCLGLGNIFPNNLIAHQPTRSRPKDGNDLASGPQIYQAGRSFQPRISEFSSAIHRHTQVTSESGIGKLRSLSCQTSSESH